MADRAVRLSGEHPALPWAELEALLAVHDPAARIERIADTLARIHVGDEAATDAALARMALLHEASSWLTHGTLKDAIRHAAPLGPGTVAVRAARIGPSRTLRTNDVERALGAALVEAGATVDLETPDHVLTAWIDGARITLGWRTVHHATSPFETRHMTDRAHFSPIGLHPRRAASLVHLAQVPPGGRILDPFCGTGGILLEAALDGYDAWGSDIDDWMVQGTYQTLTDAAAAPLAIRAVQADIGDAPDLFENVDGIVADLPYGRASTTNDEAIQLLYNRAFESFAKLLAPGKRAVIGCAEPDLLAGLDAAGFETEAIHAERVHKSLTRHYAVARRR